MNSLNVPNKQQKSRTTLSSTPQSLLQHQDSAPRPSILMGAPDRTLSSRKTYHQLLTWENMYGDFQKSIKEKFDDAPLKGQLKRKLVERDPIEVSTPLLQPNIFKFNERLRIGFREYLNGERTALNLVNECNHMNHQTAHKFKAKVKRVQRANMFAAQLQSNNKYNKLHFLGFTDEELDRKIRVQIKFDKIRKVVMKRAQEKKEEESDEPSNFKDVVIFRNLYETCEDHKKRILQKNLLTERVDGKREYEDVQYSKNPLGTLRIRESEKQRKLNKSVNSIRLEERQAAKRQGLKLRVEIREKLESMQRKKLENENSVLQVARKNLMRERRRQMRSKDSKDSGPVMEPLAKDVKLYAYLFGRKHDHKKKQKLRLASKDRLCNTDRQREESKHFLINFQDGSASREDSLSDDSSLNSLMEIHIDNLYRTSNNLQKTLLENNTEKFVKRIKQFQKVQQLNDQIIKLNQMKLSQRKLL